MQVEWPVINASPLIFLASVNGLEWIAKIATNPVTVPLGVRNEVAAGEGGSAIVAQIESDSRFYIAADVRLPDEIIAWDLGAGESQVLAHSLLRTDSSAILDDKAARDCAKSLNLHVLGTLGIVMIAKRRGWIERVQPVVAHLRATGMFLSDVLVREVLREMGEG